MFFPDVLKFLNRLGVRPVNDVTAQVTAQVTAGMDPEGMGAHMGAGLQVVGALPFDPDTIIQAMTTVINTGNNSVMTHYTKLTETTMVHVDKAVKKENVARKKVVKGIRAALQAQNEDMKLQNEGMKLQNEDLQKRLALLEEDAACNKRPRNAPNEAPRHVKNIVSNKFQNSFGWSKMVKGVSNGKKGFASAEEAALDMERFYAASMLGGVYDSDSFL
jgi:hypothetical protein